MFISAADRFAYQASSKPEKKRHASLVLHAVPVSVTTIRM